MRTLICLSLFVFSSTLAFASPDKDLLKGLSGINVSEVRAALAAGANPNVRNNVSGREKSALQIAANFGANANFNQLNMVMTLVKAGADVNASDSEGDPIIFSVVNRNDVNLELLELLLLKKPNVNATSAKNYNRTPIAQLAVNSDFVNDGNIPAIKMLLDAGADPSIRDSNGKSALDFARKAEVKQLISSKMPAGGLINNIGGGKPAINIPKNIKLW